MSGWLGRIPGKRKAPGRCMRPRATPDHPITAEARHLGRVVQPATCPACDGEFLPNRKNPRLLVANQVYCSRQCAPPGRWGMRSPNRYRTRRIPGGGTIYLRVTVPPRICEQCGESYVPKRREDRNRFCSKQCGRRARNPPHPRSRRVRDRLIPAERPCLGCGVLFAPKRNAYAVFCGKPCRQRVRRAALAGPRRAVKSLVAERDGWRCGICGDLVDPSCRFPDPLSASVDHIVLVAVGGSNDLANLRLAHLGCNMRRGGWTKLSPWGKAVRQTA